MIIFGLYGAFVVVSYFIVFACLTAVSADANLLFISGMILGTILHSLSQLVIEFANKKVYLLPGSDE